MTANRPRAPLRDYFAGIAEYAFQTRVGIADPPLIDYISDLLIRFIRADSLYNVRDLGGRRIGEVALMMAEAEARGLVQSAFAVLQFEGDYLPFANDTGKLVAFIAPEP